MTSDDKRLIQQLNIAYMRCPLLLIYLIFNNLIFAQPQFACQPKVEGFEYIEIIKGDDNAKLPLLITFHYSSGTPEQTATDYDNITAPVRIIIPKGNYKKRDGYSYFTPDYYSRDSAAQFNMLKVTTDSLANFVTQMTKKYESKAIVSGISQGGDIAFMLAATYPTLCRASFPMAAVIHGEVLKGLESTSGERTPIYLFQGEDDKIVSIIYTRRKVKEIGKMLKISFFTYPGVGHDISSEMKKEYSLRINEINQGFKNK